MVTRQAIAWAKRWGIEDIPNARSSHDVPTPRGGGIGIVIAFLIGFLVFLFSNPNIDFARPLLLAGILIAITGGLDDRFNLPAWSRLLVQVVVSGWALHSYFSLLPLFSVLLLLIYLVWHINLFNFMDGVDELAAVETVSVGLVLALLHFINGHFPIGFSYLLVATAAGGFYRFNRSPARIFMGDIGSGFLGFCLGFLSLVGARDGQITPWAHLVIFGCFLVDATMTLWVRCLNKERIFSAHRDHAYQHLVQLGLSHRAVARGVGLINFLWLAPISLFVTRWPQYGLLGISVAYVPLLFIAIKYRAGVRYSDSHTAKI